MLARTAYKQNIFPYTAPFTKPRRVPATPMPTQPPIMTFAMMETEMPQCVEAPIERAWPRMR